MKALRNFLRTTAVLTFAASLNISADDDMEISSSIDLYDMIHPTLSGSFFASSTTTSLLATILPTNTPPPANTPTFNYPVSLPLAKDPLTVFYSSPFSILRKASQFTIEAWSPPECMLHLEAGYSPGAASRGQSGPLLMLAVGATVTAMTGNPVAGATFGVLAGLAGFVAGGTTGTPFSEATTYSQSVVGYACRANGVTNIPNQRYRFVRAGDWGHYGWVTDLARSPFIGSLPSCLTRDESDRLTMKTCSYREVNGVRKVVDEQMWSFSYELQEAVPGTPPLPAGTRIGLLHSKAGGKGCVKERGSSECKYFYTGNVELENNCKTYPIGIRVCSAQPE